MEEILNYKRDANEDFYSILGCGENCTDEQILAEYKVRALECHPDKHPDDEQANERFTRLLHAKDVLLFHRQSYDTWRRSGVAIPYKQWAAHQDTMGMSMHWANKKSEPMLPETDKSQPADVGRQADCGIKNYWKRDDVSDALRKFRNYQI